jgi:hypothetical protein
MAICTWCDQEMTTATSCTVEAFHQGGERLSAPRNGRRRCGDCGTGPRGFHHPGCDLADCPACGRQMLTCGCRFDEDGDLPDDEDDEDDDWDDEDDDDEDDDDEDDDWGVGGWA